MDFRVHDKEDFDNTISFLELEKQMDAENCKEMLNIEPSHLTKAKITEIGKLAGRYKKESDRLIKSYKEQNKSKKDYERYALCEDKKTWLKKIREFDLENLRSFTRKEFEDTMEEYMKGKKKWYII